MFCKGKSGLHQSAAGHPNMTSKKYITLCLCWFTVSVSLVIVGIVLLVIWPLLLRHLIDSNLVLNNGSHAFEVWKRMPEAFPIDFYFFNWTNPEDVYNNSVKARFKEMGPYRFWETKEKSGIIWNDNGTVTYKHLKYWYYNEETANNDIKEKITTINPVAISAVYTSRHWSYLVRKGLSLTFSNIAPTVHITRTVNEMLFEGYKDPLISMAKTLPFLAGASLPPWDKFGWFYTRNGSADYEGVFNMGTGISTTFGKLYSWNHQTQTSFFAGNCGKINGSAGEFFVHPNKESISLFSPDLCRTIVLKYFGETVVDNILGYKYKIDKYMLDNGTLYPENECFCNGECVPSGLVNVSSCRFGSPSFASLPHFYQADPYYVDTIDGMTPDSNKHEFYIVIEPNTGVPLEVSARLQINLLLQPVSGIGIYENVPKIFIPMLWFEQKVRIPAYEAPKLRLLLNLPVICTASGILMVFFGLIALSFLVYKICSTKLCSKKKDLFLYPEQTIPLKMSPAAKS